MSVHSLRSAAVEYPVDRRERGLGAAIIVLAAASGFLTLLLLAAAALGVPLA